MRPPRALTDLPYARFLTEAEAPPARSGDCETLHFAGMDLSGVRADGARFLECAFSSVDFTEAHLRAAFFNDVWMQSVRFVGSALGESRWIDSEISVGSLAGTALFGSELTRVHFVGCKLVSVNLREARLRDVTFTDCTLDGVDFSGATLTDVSFPGSSLREVRFDRAKMKNVDLREARDLSLHVAPDALSGLVITGLQLLDLAPAFAQALGVRVAD